MGVLFVTLGIISILYFVCIELFTGHGTNFYFIWLFIGIILLIWGISWIKGWIKRVPNWIRKGTLLCVILGGACFLLVEGLILSRYFETGKPGLDYIVVLGAQLRESGPSTVLRYRLDKAYEYYLENPDVVVVVSGGQGANEPKPEAEGMAEYLMLKGIPKESILIENKSTSTVENLEYSSNLINEESSSVGIISNDFHIFRATKIAEKIGYKDVCGIAAKSYPFLQPQNMLREFFGVVKDFIFGNM